MAILYLIPGFPRRSETFVLAEVDGLKALGMSLRVVSFGPSLDSEVSAMGVEALQAARETVCLRRADLVPWPVRLDRRRLAMAWRLNRRLAREVSGRASACARFLRALAVARLAREGAFTHVHAHWAPGAQVAAVVNALTGIPFSLSIHAHEATTDCGHFGAVFETMAFACFCNRAVFESVCRRFGSAASRCHLIYHGTNLERFATIPLPPSGGVFRVVSAGRLSEVKHFDRLVRSLHVAVQRGLNVHLTIVGAGDLRAAIEELAAELGVSSRLTITGWLPHAEVASELAKGHVFTLMADDYGLPNVVLEAQAVGRPVLLSPMVAAGEAVEPGVNGWIVSAPDAYAEVADCWQRLAADENLLNRMAASARQFVARNHDRGVHLRHLAELLREHGQPIPLKS